jgi:hypothetical protein
MREEVFTVHAHRRQNTHLESSNFDKANHITSIYKVAMLKRTFVSEYNGKTVVDQVPPHRRVTIELKIQDLLAPTLKSVMQKYRTHLWAWAGRTVMNAAAARQMAQRTTFFGFDGFTWSADKCDTFRRDGKDLWDLMESIQRENPNLEFYVLTCVHYNQSWRKSRHLAPLSLGPVIDGALSQICWM